MDMDKTLDRIANKFEELMEKAFHDGLDAGCRATLKALHNCGYSFGCDDETEETKETE